MLLRADGELGEEEIRELQKVLDSRKVKGKVIQVPTRGFVIVKTTGEFSPALRDPEARLRVGGRALEPVLTSGAIGKLKRAAAGAGEEAHWQST